MIVLWWTKSVTATESVMSWVSVPSQRSAIVHWCRVRSPRCSGPLVRNLPWALACSSCSELARGGGRGCVAGLVRLQSAYEGAPLNAPSTSVSVVRPLSAPRPVCESREDRAAEHAVLGLVLAERRDKLERSLERVDHGARRDLRAPVSRTNAPDGDRMNTVPVTGCAFSVVPRTGAGGAAASGW